MHPRGEGIPPFFERSISVAFKTLKPAAWLLPQPVLMIGTYDADGNPDVMNAAWGGMYDGDLVELCLSEGHKTTHNILANREFTIGFATAKTIASCDYLGLVSANKVADKVEKSGLTTTKAADVNAPVIEQLPMSLECRLVGQTKNGNIIGKIVGILADESVLNEEGKVDADKLDLAVFMPVDNTYRSVNSVVGQAFGEGRKLF